MIQRLPKVGRSFSAGPESAQNRVAALLNLSRLTRARLRAKRALFFTGRENGLEMRALFFARDDRDFDVLETGFFQKLVQLHFAEAEPVIGIKFARLFETMAEQIENHEAAALSLKCDARAAMARSGWMA